MISFYTIKDLFTFASIMKNCIALSGLILQLYTNFPGIISIQSSFITLFSLPRILGNSLNNLIKLPVLTCLAFNMYLECNAPFFNFALPHYKNVTMASMLKERVLTIYGLRQFCSMKNAASASLALPTD